MSGDNSGTVRAATNAMGTRFEVMIATANRPDAAVFAERAIELIEGWHSDLSRFGHGGTVAAINRTAGGAISVDREVGGLLARCLVYAHESGGAFSVVRRGESFVPTLAGLGVTGDGAQAGLASGETSLDLGGVAKGFALDMIRDELSEFGVAGAFIHGGTSSIMAMGEGPDDAPWAVRLDAGEGVAAPAVRLRDRSMSVSSQTGDRPGHIIDPRTGSPAGGRGFAACIGESAEETDAWSTALAVLGERPATMPRRLTSVVRCPATDGASAWAVEGPDRDAVSLPQTQPGDQP